MKEKQSGKLEGLKGIMKMLLKHDSQSQQNSLSPSSLTVGKLV